MAKPYKRKDSRFWWIAPTINGVQVPQSSGETDYDRAERKLKILEGKLAANAPITARTDRDSFASLLELVRTDYKIKKNRSLYDTEKRIDKALIPFMGHLPAGKAWLEIDNYILARQNGEIGKRQRKASNATINRELAIVRRAYRLGERKGLVSHVPHIEKLPEGTERDGYYLPGEFQSVLANAEPLVRNILTVAYTTGWRMRSIFRLQWSQVDFIGGFVWQTERKNEKATRWPLDTMGLRQVFEEQRRLTDSMKDRICPFVFHRNGKPVKSIRGSFKKACKAAKVSHVFHDLRGTAIVNLLEAGLDSPTIMNMVGLKSERMVIHYAKKRGMREDRLKEAGKLLEMRLKGKPATSGTT